jgi:hypothetical protein
MDATSAGHGTRAGTADAGMTPTTGVTDKWCLESIGANCAITVTSLGSRAICRRMLFLRSLCANVVTFEPDTDRLPLSTVCCKVDRDQVP